MRMIRPQLNVPTQTIAEDSEVYHPLTVAVLTANVDGTPPYFVISAWRFTPEEREAIALGADLYLSLTSFDGSISPQSLMVGKEVAAAAFGIEVEPTDPPLISGDDA